MEVKTEVNLDTVLVGYDRLHYSIKAKQCGASEPSAGASVHFQCVDASPFPAHLVQHARYHRFMRSQL